MTVTREFIDSTRAELERLEKRKSDLLDELMGINDAMAELKGLLERYDGQGISSNADGNDANGAAPEVSPPAPAPKPKAAKPRAATPKQRNKRLEELQEMQRRIIALAESKGEITAKDVAEELGLPPISGRVHLRRLVMNGGPLEHVGGSGRKGDPRRYGVRRARITVDGGDGAKTEVERKVLRALEELGQATAGEVQEASGVRRSAVPAILGALHRRGVVRQLPGKDGAVARWEVAN